ncbi:GIP [Symbiodinium pilosum]|uniref:GIP protein n=1 Tax=Symbiodinium pilosum TaxID=2952 RepID=A0A812U5L7_SYMPI|nr:GIP [Symbiodinium pilosum]
MATPWSLSQASNCALQAKTSFLLPTQFHRRFLLHLTLVALEATWTYVLNPLLILLLKTKTRDLGNDPAFLDQFSLCMLRLWFPALIFPSSMDFYLLNLKETMAPQVLDQVNSKFIKNQRRFQGRAPYFTEDFLWDVEPLTRTVRECRLRKMIKLKDLSPENRSKFLASMEKEWTSWMKFNAVEILTPAQILSLPGDVRIIGTRWVRTDKNQKQRLLALHLCQKTAKSREQVTKEYPFAAKSRLVAQGHQEDASDLRTDSPTASLLAFNLVSAVAGISRLLILRPAGPPPPGLGPNDLLRAKGSIYGTKDAGRSWWKKLYKTLRKNGWRMSAIEPALFILADGSSLLGGLITHVDNLYSCGEGQAYVEGEWQLRPSEAAQEKKLLIRAGRHARKAARARAEDGC